MGQHLNKQIGNVVEFSKTDTGVSILTNSTILEITFYTEEIVRLNYRPIEKKQIDFSYALATSPATVFLEVLEQENVILIQSAALKLEIQKNKTLIRFFDKNNQLLNEDHSSFGVSNIGSEVSCYKALQAGERFLGLGEKTGNLDRRGAAYTNWNTDKFAYTTDQDPLYMSIPFFIGVHSNIQYGIFFDNSFKTKFNFGASNNRFAYFAAEDGEMNYYFIAGNSVPKIIENYSVITGKMELPPLWSLGLQQCRYSYYPASEVLQVAKTFREKRIPCDMIYLDIHYMQDYKVFTFDKERFENPIAMQEELASLNFYTTVILDPGIKVENNYPIYEEGKEKNLFVKYPDGENFEAEVWPGWSHFPDFTDSKVRTWWGEKLKFYTEKNIYGFWNDMNEPACWGQSPPDLIEFDYEGDCSTHKRARNVYGMQMARSTFEGAKKINPNKRPFILNRAGYSGVQRYSASWTGDNVASDENMLCGVQLVNSLGLSGVPFAGFDVGGFCGDGDAELFAKWIVLGAFSPLFRCHSMINSRDAEPWAFGEEVEEISRNYIALRYRLLPYIYSAFYEASQTGMPVSRSLALLHPHDEKIYETAFQNQYYFGNAIFVPAIVSRKELEKIYFPSVGFYDLHTDKFITEQNYITEIRKERYPLFVKQGSIIPMQSAIQHTSQPHNGMLEIHIYKGIETTTFCLFEDDGVSYDFENEHFSKRNIIADFKNKSISFSKIVGNFETTFKTYKIYFHGFSKIDLAALKNIQSECYQFIQPVSHFDPFYKPTVKDMQIDDLNFVILEVEKAEMILKW